MDDVKTNDTEEKKEEVADVRTPEQKVQDVLKEYDFIKFTGGVFMVNHEELKAALKPKILTMGDISARGRILAAHNGGANISSIDQETLTLNTFLATIQVGFEDLKLDLMKVRDSNLIDALYLAVKAYNSFFRTSPLGIIL